MTVDWEKSNTRIIIVCLLKERKEIKIVNISKKKKNQGKYFSHGISWMWLKLKKDSLLIGGIFVSASGNRARYDQKVT